MNNEKNKQGRMRQELDRRAGVLEDVLSKKIGDTKFSWGFVVLALGAVWAGYELISALIYFF